MYKLVYFLTIMACALLGASKWGNVGLFYGAGLGFLMAPAVGYIYQVWSNRRQVQGWAADYMKTYPEKVDIAFPEAPSLKRIRLLEHTMLSLSAIVQKYKLTGDKQQDAQLSVEAREAVEEYAKDCAIDEKVEQLEKIIVHLYEWLLEKREDNS